jgi:NAD(P)-dependent dehydrogenase (short-subunit alcohol dehydrogenase family)
MNTKKVVVVTGASAGLGRAIVREFAKRGDHIALLARGIDGLAGAKKEVEALGGQALAFPLDVANAEAVEQAATEIEAKLGPIDIWINNAMNSVFSPIKNMTADEYKRVTEVTYLGQVYGALSALKRMRSRNKGCIIFVGSALAYRGIPLQSAYCASKHAIQGFYDSFRTELLHDGLNIRTCMLQLPAMNTTQFGLVRNKLPFKPRPMGMIYEPEVAARAVLFATEHNRREIYVGLPTVEAIVGNKMLPGFADHYLAQSGYKGQMTKIPEDRERKDNLWTPVAGDHGVHGPFGEKAYNFSIQLWAAENKKLIGGILMVALCYLAYRIQNRYAKTRKKPVN